MRLSEEKRNIILNVCFKYDNEAKVFLFGSRTDDNRKGGDIDLLIQSKKLSQKDARQIKYNLWDKLGEQKIDIIITENFTEPFAKVIQKECIQL